MSEPMPPPADDELPPPPSDMVEETKKYPEIEIRKSGPLATLRRAIVIFEKDMRTMAKHGLVSSIILFVFLSVVFYIMSFTMFQAMSMDVFEGEDGPDIGTGVNPPTADAGDDMTIDAGDTVTFDSSGSSDNGELVYFEWHFWDMGRDVSLYGPSPQYTFMATGEYHVNLIVVDDELNVDEDNVTIQVNRAGSDTEYPTIVLPGDQYVSAGMTVTLDASACSDNMGIAAYVWSVNDIVTHILTGEIQTYEFNYAGSYYVDLFVVDEAGNSANQGFQVVVSPTGTDMRPPEARFEVENLVNIGETVQLDASQSWDDQGIVDYAWFISHNGTTSVLHGQVTSFEPDEFGMYDVVLVVSDSSGNAGWSESGVIALPEEMDVSHVGWTSTPFGTDVSFNVLTYSYGIALLASVIFIGGLFAKGFTHEITKGTIKVLFFGPISVTTMIFSKVLYPIVFGAVFIFPLVFIALAPFHHGFGEIMVITTVSYLLAVLTMVSAAYGSNMIYLVTRRMVLKPSIISRMFLYFSLLATMTVFEWFSFLLDMWTNSTMWGDMYHDYGGSIAMFSPFHQGGVFLSKLLIGTAQSPDYVMFVIPAALIIGGVIASRRLYGDLFSRE